MRNYVKYALAIFIGFAMLTGCGSNDKAKVQVIYEQLANFDSFVILLQFT